MAELIGTAVPGIAAVAVLGLAGAVLLVLPAGREMLSALLGSVARWPALIRAELRGAAPLRVEGPGDGRDERRDTTPDIPAVTCGLPVVQRPDRV